MAKKKSTRKPNVRAAKVTTPSVDVAQPIVKPQQPTNKCCDGTMRDPVGRAMLVGLILLILVMLLMAACPHRAQSAEPRNHDAEYAMAYHAAHQQNKPLLLLIGAEWCQPCKQVVQEFTLDLKARGAYVHMDWDLDATFVRPLFPRALLPALIVWERGPRGVWHKRVIVGEPAIRWYLSSPRRLR